MPIFEQNKLSSAHSLFPPNPSRRPTKHPMQVPSMSNRAFGARETKKKRKQKKGETEKQCVAYLGPLEWLRATPVPLEALRKEPPGGRPLRGPTRTGGLESGRLIDALFRRHLLSCRKCGLSTKEPKHLKLKIRKSRRKQAHTHTTQNTQRSSFGSTLSHPRTRSTHHCKELQWARHRNLGLLVG